MLNWSSCAVPTDGGICNALAGKIGIVGRTGADWSEFGASTGALAGASVKGACEWDDALAVGCIRGAVAVAVAVPCQLGREYGAWYAPTLNIGYGCQNSPAASDLQRGGGECKQQG